MAGAAQEVVLEWVRAVMEARDLRRAWELTDPDLRLVLAQHWIWAHQGEELVGGRDGWDEIAGALAASPSEHPLWDRFARERLRRWRESWSGLSTLTWELHDSEPEVLGDDVVVVALVPRSQKWRDLRPGPPPAFRRFAVRERPDGWRMAGLDGAALYRPGWPPERVT